MAGYLIFEIEITDPEAYERYRAKAAPVLARHGGRFLVRAGKAEALEGGWQPNRFFVVEFDSTEAARAFYRSDAYQEALGLRLAASRSRAFLIDGA